MTPSWDFKILIDGACPLCRREGEFFKRLDRGRGRLVVEDISDPDFDPEKYGTTWQDVTEQIHGVLPSGRLVRGMEVFRKAYTAVGLGWMLMPTRWPIVRPLADRAYTWFARNRIRITGRGTCCQTASCEA
jgi:predicted DCC family thiol-disulfide oxidoreductase YuxK